MTFPVDLEKKFTPIRTLKSTSRRATWLVKDNRTDTFKIIKYRDTSLYLPASYFSQFNSDYLLTPIEIDSLENGFYEVYDYFKVGNLNEAYPANLSNDLLYRLAYCIIDALNSLGAHDIAHGDIKPQNVIFMDNLNDPGFTLCDWDTARITNESSNEIYFNEYTLLYASPQLIATGQPDIANDFWAFGMLLYEKILGKHPFSGLDETFIKQTLTTWRPNLKIIEDERLRALVSGLLVQSSRERWGVNELNQWLDFNNHAIIVQGLGLGDEYASNQPFTCNYFSAYTITGVANQLIKMDFNSADDVLNSEDFRIWLASLNRADISAVFNHAINLDSPRERILNFCYSINNELPPIWNEYELNRSSIRNQAMRAIKGDELSKKWIASLMDGFAFSYFSKYSDELNHIGRIISENWANYHTDWDRIVAAGAPNNSKLEDDKAYALLVSLCINNTYLNTVKSDLVAEYDPKVLLSRSEWYFIFGNNVNNLSLSQILILHCLSSVSRLKQISVFDSTADLNLSEETVGRDKEVSISSLQNRFMTNKYVAADPNFINLQGGDYHLINKPRSRLKKFFQSCWLKLHRHIYRERVRQELAMPKLNVRAVAVHSVNDSISTLVEDIEYVALVTWQVDSNENTDDGSADIKLILSEPSLIYNRQRYFIPRLSKSGQMLFTLGHSTQFRLEKDNGFLASPDRSASICLFLNRVKLKSGSFKMQGVLEKFINSVNTKMYAFNKSILKSSPLLDFKIEFLREIKIEKLFKISNFDFKCSQFNKEIPSLITASEDKSNLIFKQNELAIIKRYLLEKSN